MWRLTVTHRKMCDRLLSYLEDCPLRGEKNRDRARWQRGLRYAQAGLHRPGGAGW
jgi:hypothetical protein